MSRSSHGIPPLPHLKGLGFESYQLQPRRKIGKYMRYVWVCIVYLGLGVVQSTGVPRIGGCPIHRQKKKKRNK
ncbi:uncharacterized protein DS421_4g126280 [Arachis hypogaea]|nr:uncharacterized protein DS421_4g126280 [Arachis hypogaea]